MTLRTRLVDVHADGVPEDLLALQMEVFPCDDEMYPRDGWWWVVRDGDRPVAFATLRVVPSWRGSGYLARCGVLKSHRGRGLQLQLLRARQRKAKELGMVRLITTTLDNPISANNLIKAGFRTYLPEVRWGSENTIYWRKDLYTSEKRVQI